MPPVESFECPKCGAAVPGGAARTTCQYCGASLRVAAGEPEHVAAPKTEIGAAGVRVHLDPNARHFGPLPDLEVTRDLKDIPYKPLTLYGPGNFEPDPASRDDAQQILDLLRRAQQAINEKSADLFLSLLSAWDPAFVKAVGAALARAFAAGDLKRFTATVNFHQLKRDRAEAGVISETFIFGPGEKAVAHETATHNWKFRREPDGWRVAGVALSGAKRGHEYDGII